MKADNVKYLKANRQFWEKLKVDSYFYHFGQDVRENFLRIYREELDPRAIYCLTCPEDLAHMVRTLYLNFEKYEASENGKVQPEPIKIKKRAK